MRRWITRGVTVAIGIGAAVAILTSSEAGSQTPPFSIPSFTTPTFTIPPPPTRPPFTTPTTAPPPTMAPPTSSTSTPPPTMAPRTIPSPDLPGSIESQIEDLIDQLERFGDEFQSVINELEGILARF